MIRDQKGLTLIEIAIGLALLSSAMVVAVMTFTSISKLQQKGVAVRGVQQSGRYVVEQLARDIRSASVVTLAETPPTDVGNSGKRFPYADDETSSTEETGDSLRMTNGWGQLISYTYDAENQQILRELCEATCTGTGTAISVTGARFVDPKFTIVRPGNNFNKPYVRIALTVRQPDRSLDDDTLLDTNPNKQQYELNTVVGLRGM